jgi:CheY-like chemotaxis protein
MVKCYERPPQPEKPFRDLPHSSQQTEDTKQSRRASVEKVELYRDACLIVDDSPLNRKLLEKHLRSHFKVIHFAENGLEAIETIKKRTNEGLLPYDLVCLDSVMPVSDLTRLLFHTPFTHFLLQEMNGPEAIQRLRRMGYDGLVVGITGNALSDQILEFKSAGVDEVLTKPVDIEMLLSLVVDHRLSIV